MMDATAQVSESLNKLSAEFDVIAHNLANVSTAGYKRRCSIFSKALDAQNSQIDGTSQGQAGAESALDFSQGTLMQTGRTLDVALQGEGFFVIETPEGPLYTRHGIFHANQNGQLVDSQGRVVAGDGGPLSLPASVSFSQISIGEDGRITAAGQPVGQFRIVAFGNDEGQLVPMGLNCYAAPEDVRPTSAQGVTFKQGYQESSNVAMVEELVGMIMVQRMYEASMKLTNAKKDTTSSVMSVAMG